MKKGKRYSTCIYIGIRKRAVTAAGKVIMDILACDQDQDTIRSALTAFTNTLSINNTNIANNIISQKVPSETDDA